MRKNWRRHWDDLHFSNAKLADFLTPVLPGAVVTGQETLSGGLSNTSIRVRCRGEETPLVLRFYRRDSTQAGKERAIHALLENFVPLPRILYQADSNDVSGHAYAVLEWVEGQSLTEIESRIADFELQEIGRQLGSTLAIIHSFPFSEMGFPNGDLEVVSSIQGGGLGFVLFVHDYLERELVQQRLGPQEAERTLEFALREAQLLDSWQPPPSLTHGDFGHSNILIREQNGTPQIAAILDWEFAFSGSPLFDLGNLLRPPLESRVGFSTAVAEGYRSAGAELPADWQRMSKLLDLTAWIEFLSRSEVHDTVIEDARRTIRRTREEWKDAT